MEEAVETARGAISTVLDPETSDDRRIEAEEWLGSLPDHFVSVVFELLENNEGAAAEEVAGWRYWAAGWLLSRARASHPLDRETLLEAALALTRDPHSAGGREAAGALCRCIAAVAVRAPVGEWPDVVATLIHVCSTADSTGHKASTDPSGHSAAGPGGEHSGAGEGETDPAADLVLLRILAALPDELFREIDKRVLRVPTGDVEENAMTELVGGAAAAAEAVRTRLMQSEQSFIEGSRVLASWLDRELVGLFEVHDLLPPIVDGLSEESDVIFTAAVECLSTVAAIQTADPDSLLTLAQCMGTVPLDSPPPDRAATLCAIPAGFVEGKVKLLLSCEVPDGLDALFFLLDRVYGCWVGAGGGDDLDLTDVGLKLSHAVVLAVVESEDRVTLVPSISPLLTGLIPAVRDKIIHTPEGHDECVAFDALVKSAGDLVGMVCFLCKGDAVGVLHSELAEAVAAIAAHGAAEGSGAGANADPGTGVDAGGGEGGEGDMARARAQATLTLLGEAAALLPMCDSDETIHEIFRLLDATPVAHPTLVFVGNMASWLAQREELLISAAELVVGCLTGEHSTRTVRIAAARALAELCTFAPEPLKPVLPLLCEGTDLAGLLRVVPGEAKAILRAVGLLVGQLSGEEAEHYMQHSVIPYVMQIESMADETLEHQLSVLAGTAALIDALGDTSESLSFATFEAAWPGLCLCFRSHVGEEDIIVAAALCVAKAFDSSADPCQSVAECVVAEILTCFDTCHEAALLTTLKEHILSIVCAQRGQGGLVQRVTQALGDHLGADPTAAHGQGTAAGFELLTEVYVISQGGAGVEYEVAQRGFDLAAGCLRTGSRAVVKAATRFLCRLIRAAGQQGDEVAAETVQSGISPLLEQVLSGLAWDVPRECFGDLARVFETLATSCLDLFRVALSATLGAMEGVPVANREALAEVLLSAPYNYPRALDAVTHFAEAGRAG